jgi:Mg-chelatase subunit ChlD
MTKERGQDLVAVVIVLSVAIHVGLMLFVRSKVMTHVDRSAFRERHRDAMHVEDYRPVEDPVAIERIRDIMSAREAPEAEASDAPAPATEQLPDSARKHWNGDVPAPEAPAPDEVPVAPEAFDVTPIRLDEGLAPDPVPTVEYVPPESRALTAPTVAAASAFAMPVSFGAPQPAAEAPRLPPAPVERASIDAGPVAKAEVKAATPAPVPDQEVYDKVDEKIVEKEKEAVRELMDVEDAAPLEKFVNLSALRADDGQWTYFKLMVSPRTSLQVVPKDVVVLIDASGSIGSERLLSCRTAAKGILRSALNSGDRFNLVAFRNNFSYAFRRWQDCNQMSFAAADRWLSNLAAHGRTDVFGTIRSVLTLPRDPRRPLIALVVTDGDANAGVSDTAQILSKFTDLNDGLVSVYMYGVKSSANRELIDVLTHGNRGESFIFGGLRWKAGSGIESLSERFRDPVLTDLRVIFTAASRAEAYPRLLRNLYRGDTVTLVGRVPKGVEEVSFSLKGLNGSDTYEAFFKVPLGKVATSQSVVSEWSEERAIDAKLR